MILVRKRAAEDPITVEDSQNEEETTQEERRANEGLSFEEDGQEVVTAVDEDNTRRDYIIDLEEENAELGIEFRKQLDEIGQTSISEMEPRAKLLKLKMTTQVERSSNRILEKHLQNVNEMKQ